MSRHPDEAPPLLTWIGAFVLLAILALLYLIPASTLGFWEPWETSLAALGRSVATDMTLSPWVPSLDGELLARPWLQTWLVSIGYALGDGSEFGFRVPFAALVAASAVYSHVVLARTFGPFRAFAAALLFGVTPAALLSATSLAGEAYYLAPLTAALVTAGGLVAEPSHRPWLRLPLLGALLGFCMWGLGAPGLAMPLLVLGLFAAGSRTDEGRFSPIPLGIGVVGLLLSVGFPLIATWSAGSAAIADAGAEGGAWAAGWATHKDIVGVSVCLGAPLSLLVATASGSRARAFWHPIYTPVAIVVFAAIVVPPVFGTFIAADLAGVEPADTWGYLLYHSFLSDRVMPDHVTFDLVLRMTAFSAYPAVMLAPLGMAYMLQTAEPTFTQTDDDSDGARAFKLMLVIWTGVAFGVLGIAATLARQYTFAIALPVTTAMALALSDRAWLKSLFSNRSAWYVAGLSSLLLLVVLSKDVRGTYNEELGRPGPHVIFELLLTDGRVAFPSEYALQNVQFFVTAWMLVLVLFFARPIFNLERIAAIATSTAQSFAERRGLFPKLAGAARLVGRVFGQLAALGEKGWKVIARGASGGTVALATLTAVIVAWGAALAFGDVPAMTHHFSQKGIIDTYHRFSDEGETLHTAGIGANTNTYYLQSEGITAHARVADLRQMFCDAGDERVFVVIPTDEIGAAYYHVRREQENQCNGLDLYVIDARSSRYLLASNQLDEAQGETQQSFIAENVFTDETLPANIDRPATQTMVGDDLELVGFRVYVVEDGEEGGREVSTGEVAIEGYFRVRSTPPSGYESFIHVDFGANRINGDHDLVEGRFPMNYWVPGDIVRDRHVVEVSRADRSGEYTVWYGFFRGDDRLVLDPPAGDNRMNFGLLQVRH